MNKDNFLNTINTLKLYHRSELLDDDGKRLIKDLYIDPLPDDHVLKTILRPNSTFLIGRKGTGKSTIFQMAQEILDNDKRVTWAYIDIKTLFESSTSVIIGNPPAGFETSLSQEAITKLFVFKSFVIELVKEIKKQISQRIKSTIWNRIQDAFTGTTLELFEKLDELIQEIEQDDYFNVTGSIKSIKQNDDLEREKVKIEGEGSLKLSDVPNFNVKLIGDLVEEIERKRSHNYSQVFIRIFNIRGIIARLREILSILKLKHIYIFVDDFSELPRNNMEEVVDTILSPFNNWSDDFISKRSINRTLSRPASYAILAGPES